MIKKRAIAVITLITLLLPFSAGAAESQLRFVGEEAGDKVNLLSAFGQDGELFDRLRRICD